MTFIWARMLWLLAAVPLLVAVYLFLLRRRRRTAVRYASLSMVREAMGAGPGFRRHVPPLLLLSALAVTLLAVARPAAVVTLPSQRGTIILAMDVSGSMRAADVDPDRITAAQDAARTFIDNQSRTTRVGIVAFAGTAMLVQPPTLDRGELRAAIDRFQLQRGTNIGDAILVSLQTLFPDADIDLGPTFWRERDAPRGFAIGEAPAEEQSFVPVEPGSHTSAVIVLLTDGQATTGPDPLTAARLAADRGVRIYTVGFGSRAGDVVGFEGWSMRVQLDEESLRQVAEATRARYFHAGTATDLNDVYRALSTELVMETELTEITAFFAAGAGFLMFTAAMLSMLWFGRIV